VRRVLAFYLAALIFGLGLFAVQLLASGDAGHHDVPALPGADGHHDGGGLIDDASLAVHGSGARAHADGADGWASIFVSLRFYMFAAIGIGAVGAPVTLFDASAPGLTLGVALATGFGVGVLAALGFRRLGRDTLSSGATSEELVGHVGRVLVSCENGRAGKVRLTVRGQMIDLVATTDEPRLDVGAGVIVTDAHERGVHVCAAPAELLPE
jgi:membrane protein implicated in regulation of membrane protease activity